MSANSAVPSRPRLNHPNQLASSSSPRTRTDEFADIPRLWINYAYHGYLALQRVDERLLEPYLPAAIFYNLLLTARKPS
jgi:hypothetical protein